MPDPLTPPVRLDPPFREPLLTSDGRISRAWQEWFYTIADRLVALEARVTALEPP